MKLGAKRRALRALAGGCLAGSVAFSAGYVTRHNRLLPLPLRTWVSEAIAPASPVDDGMPGRWNRIELQSALPDASIEQLRAIGYVGGHDPAPEHTVPVANDVERALAGVNLFSSGHAPAAYLMDMDGTLRHKWYYPFERVWPDFRRPESTHSDNVGYWRRVHVLANGDLLAIHEGIGILRLDKDSNLLWANQCGAHHDLFVGEDGAIIVLTRKAHVLERVNPTRPILEDFISFMSPEGEITRELSLLSCFERSSYAPLLDTMKPAGDLFHTNTIERLDGRFAPLSPLFEQGNMLVSARDLNVVAIVDPDQETVLWATTGLWRRQHQPTLIEGGRMLVFDNLGHDGRSRVIELDPFSHHVFWSYGTTPDEDFCSETCGTAQRLANGNTLITVSDRGRAFEVTSENEVVWDFVSPFRAGDAGEYIATLPEVVRLPTDFPTDWTDPATLTK